MRLIRLLLSAIVTFMVCISVAFAAQNGITLRWKVTNEIEYSASMDTVHNKSSLAEAISKEGSKTPDTPGGPSRDLIAELAKPRNYDMVLKIFPLDSGDIAVELRLSDVKDKEAPTTETGKAIAELYKSMSGKLQFRAQINTRGEITSFWLPQAQKNIVSLMFQLPSAPVKEGDEWEIDANFIEMGTNFICKNSKSKRLARLVSIAKEAEDTIASIEYDITEEVEGTFDGLDSKGSTTVTFQGKADFLVDKGCWRNFTGTMTTCVKQDFMNTSQESVQVYRLVPRN